MNDDHDKLMRAMAKTVALKGHADEARQQLRARARRQYDTVTPVIEEVTDHVEADKAGGVLGYRQLKTLATERRRLGRLTGEDE